MNRVSKIMFLFFAYAFLLQASEERNILKDFSAMRSSLIKRITGANEHAISEKMFSASGVVYKKSGQILLAGYLLFPPIEELFYTSLALEFFFNSNNSLREKKYRFLEEYIAHTFFNQAEQYERALLLKEKLLTYEKKLYKDKNSCAINEVMSIFFKEIEKISFTSGLNVEYLKLFVKPVIFSLFLSTYLTSPSCFTERPVVFPLLFLHFYRQEYDKEYDATKGSTACACAA